jgi:hypothetical protein
MGPTASNKIIRFTAVSVTGLIALSAYAGVVGLLGGGISFGETIDARLPFGSLILAGLALLAFVAVPMTIAAVAAAKDTHRSADLVFASGGPARRLDRGRARVHQGLLLVPPDLPSGGGSRPGVGLADGSPRLKADTQRFR